MITFLLVVHLLVTLGMVSSILLQRSEGGGLVSSASSFMTARGSANFLTRLTAVFAAAFIFLSLILAVLAGTENRAKKSILDQDGAEQEQGGLLPTNSAPSSGGAPVVPEVQAPVSGSDAKGLHKESETPSS